MSRLLDPEGRTIVLREELGKGGEGAVFALADPTLCAKVYHRPLSAERAEKIRVMASIGSDALSRLTAWPVSLISNDRSEPVGLILPRVNGAKDIHKLYSPKSRHSEFTRADWRFLIRVAANTARAFGAVHATGCVIGDVNHGSVLVSQDATVRLIDCDSFQIEGAGRRFLCTVGVETYTPPELQGRSFEGVIRSANHDAFGLAVLVFHLLMMGRHPFSGRYMGAGDMPIGRAIEEFRFAYGSRRTDVLMERPPGAPALEIVGTAIGDLFEAAFSRAGSSGTRPTAREWITALDALERDLRQCASNQAHWHRRDNASCPWCRIEGATGLILFPLVLQATTHGTGLDLDALLTQLAGLRHPGPAPEIAPASATPSARARDLRVKRRKRYVTAASAAILVVFALAGLGIAPAAFVFAPIAFLAISKALDPSIEVAALRDVLSEAETTRDMALEEWRRHAGPQAYDNHRVAFDLAVQELRDIPALRSRRLDQLKHDQPRLQLDAFLDRFSIDGATIPGVGPGRKSQLASNGIETAADVTPASIRIPGFGPATQTKLMAWRAGLEGSFVYDPNRPVQQRDVTRVEQEVLTVRTKAEGGVRLAFSRLQQEHAHVSAVRRNMRSGVEAALAAHAQAAADVAQVR